MAKQHIGENFLLKEEEKGGEMLIFPSTGEKYACCFPNFLIRGVECGKRADKGAKICISKIYAPDLFSGCTYSPR